MFRLLEPLLPQTEDAIDAILNEALANYGTEFIVSVNDMHPNVIKDVRFRHMNLRTVKRKWGMQRVLYWQMSI